MSGSEPEQPEQTAPRKSRFKGVLADTRPLQIPEYRRLFIGGAVTVVGSQMTAVVVLQEIFSITQNSAWVGAASLVALVPLITFGLIGGAIADTYDRRKVMIVTTLGVALSSIGLWVQALVGLHSVWVIFALLAIQQGMFAVNSPTRAAIIPRIVPAHLVPAANALNMTVFSVGVIVGPLLVGLLLPLMNLSWIYFIDALTLSAVLYAAIKLPALPPAGSSSKRASVREGLGYLRGRDILLMTFVVDIIAMVFGMPRALFPEMAQHTFGGPDGGGIQLGLLNAGMAIGALIGGLTSGWLQHIRRQGIAIVAAIVIWGLAMVGMGLSGLLWMAVFFLAVGGWADMVSAVFRTTILQVAATDEMRGRLQGVFLVVVAGGPRVADMLHGLAADWSSTAIAVTGGGVLVIIGVIVAVALRPALLKYDGRVAENAADQQTMSLRKAPPADPTTP